MEKRIHALLVDDEELARSDLKSQLARFPEVEVIAEADSVSSAVEKIERYKPDLIFLDIQFPGESGFDLLDRIHTDTKIIFVTAFDEFAIRAFDVNAQDYLLKPVNPQRLALALERLEDSMPSEDRLNTTFKYDDSVFLSLNGKYHFLKLNTIMKITSAGNYSEVVTSKGLKGLTDKSMKEWEQRLPTNMFTRIHRSTIINVEFVEKIEPWFNYAYRIFLKGFDKPIVMSRRYVSIIKDRMN